MEASDPSKIVPYTQGPWWGSGPSLTDLAGAVTVQEVVADVGLQHSLPLLSRVGGGQALGCRKAKVTSLNVEKNLHGVGLS